MLKEIIGRKEARNRGLKRFFTGICCSKGHTCERMVSNGDCVQCMGVRNGKRYRDNPAYRLKVLKRTLKNYRNDPEKFRERSRRQYLKSPENFRAHSANSNAKRQGSAGRLKGADILAVLFSQHFKCHCGKSIERKYEVDHKIPLWKKGPNSIGNIQCLCFDCHKTKTRIDLRECQLSTG